MNAITESANIPIKPADGPARKKIFSKLDLFTEELLQMDEAKKTIQHMVEWLEARDVKTSASNVAAFLVSRRQRREAARDALGMRRD